MLFDDNPCRTEHAGQQDEHAEPFYRIELEDEAVGQQTAYHSPPLAMWVLILTRVLMTVQMTMQIRVATMMPLM